MFRRRELAVVLHRFHAGAAHWVMHPRVSLGTTDLIELIRGFENLIRLASLIALRASVTESILVLYLMILTYQTEYVLPLFRGNPKIVFKFSFQDMVRMSPLIWDFAVE